MGRCDSRQEIACENTGARKALVRMRQVLIQHAKCRAHRASRGGEAVVSSLLELNANSPAPQRIWEEDVGERPDEAVKGGE